MRTVHVVVPDGIDDPARPSGGNIYDRRVCAGWRRSAGRCTSTPCRAPGRDPDPAALAALAACAGGCPTDAVVLVDGLVASSGPEVLVPAARRLRLVVLVHMPLGHPRRPRPRRGGTRERARAGAAAAAAVVTTSEWTRDWLLDALRAAPGPGARGRARVSTRPTGARARPTGGELLCVAAVMPAKGHDVLLDALAALARPAVATASASARWTATRTSSTRLAHDRPRRRDRRPGRLHRPAGRRRPRRARTPRPTCWCSPRGPRPTAWSSPRRWPAACRSSRPRSAGVPEALGWRPAGPTGRWCPRLRCRSGRPGRRYAAAAAPSRPAPVRRRGSGSRRADARPRRTLSGWRSAGDRDVVPGAEPGWRHDAHAGRSGRRTRPGRAHRDGTGRSGPVARGSDLASWRAASGSPPRAVGGAAILAVVVWRLGTGPFLDGRPARSTRGRWRSAVAHRALTTVCCAWRWSLVAARPRRRRAAARRGRRLLPLAVPQHHAARRGARRRPPRRTARPRASATSGRALRAVVWERVGRAGRAGRAGAGRAAPCCRRRCGRRWPGSGLRSLVGAVPGRRRSARLRWPCGARAARPRSRAGPAASRAARRPAAGSARPAGLAAVALASVVVVAGHVAHLPRRGAHRRGRPRRRSQLLPLALLVLLGDGRADEHRRLGAARGRGRLGVRRGRARRARGCRHRRRVRRRWSWSPACPGPSCWSHLGAGSDGALAPTGLRAGSPGAARLLGRPVDAGAGAWLTARTPC